MLQQPYDFESKTHLSRYTTDPESEIIKAKCRLAKERLRVAIEQLKTVQQEIEDAKLYRKSVKMNNFVLREQIALDIQRKRKKRQARREIRKANAPNSKSKQPKSKVSNKPQVVKVPSIRNNRRSRSDKNHIRKYQPLPKHPDGQYITPVSVGILTIMSLGVVDYDNASFHNDRYIWPVGYTVKRYYNSTITLDKQVVYTASIERDKRTNRPLFRIVAEDIPDHILSPSPTGAWTEVMRLANKLRNRGFTNSASGPDYFGFSNPTIAKMIQDLPNADRCLRYKRINFEPMLPKNIPTRRWNPPAF